MVRRNRNFSKKSEPFTSIIIYLPMHISICGTPEVREKWNNFFGTKNQSSKIFRKGEIPSKANFITENFMRDIEVNNKSKIFEDVEDSRIWDKKKIEGLMLKLNYPNIQEYINFILDRAIEEEGGVNNDS